MKWSKQTSARAVSAKARLRIERAEAEPEEFAGKVYNPRKSKPDFKITIEAKTGERTQMSLVRFGKQFITSDGVRSARQIGRSVEILIRFLHL